MLLECALQQLGQRKRLFEIDEHPDHSQRCPAQGKRIFRAGRGLANAKNPNQCIKAVRQRDGRRFGSWGQLVTGKPWVIVVLNGLCHSAKLFVMTRILCAGDTL